MSVQVDIQTEVDYLRGIIAAKLPTATPKELAYLGRAIESLAGHSAGYDLIQIRTNAISTVTALATTKSSEVTTHAATKVTEVTTAGNTGVSDVNAAGATQVTNIAAVVAAAAKTAVVFANSSPIALLAGLNRLVEVTAAASLDFTMLDITLPSATTMTQAVPVYQFRNKSYGFLRLKDSGGSVIGYIAPRAWGRLETTKASANAWSFQEAPFMLTDQQVGIDATANWGSVGRIQQQYFESAGHPNYLGNTVAFPTPILDATGEFMVASADRLGMYQVSGGGPFYGCAIYLNNLLTRYNVTPSMPSLFTTNANTFIPYPPLRNLAAFLIATSSGNTNWYAETMRYDGTYPGQTMGLIPGNAAAPTCIVTMAFDKGQYAMTFFKPSSGSIVISRQLADPTGRFVAAGSITVANTGVGICQISDKHLMVIDAGTNTGSIYDMSVGGTTLSVLTTYVDASLAGMGNQFGMYLGDNMCMMSSGAYKWNGTALTRVDTSVNWSIGLSSSRYTVYPIGDGMGTFFDWSSSYNYLVGMRSNGSALASWQKPTGFHAGLTAGSSFPVTIAPAGGDQVYLGTSYGTTQSSTTNSDIRVCGYSKVSANMLS